MATSFTPIHTDTRRRADLALAAVLSGAALAATVLYRFPPAQYGFYPTCPIHQFTGLLCPGCGATRAMASLVRGDLHAALASNALVVLLLPVLAAWLAVAYRRRAFPPVPRTAIAGLITLAAAFTILRNLY